MDKKIKILIIFLLLIIIFLIFGKGISNQINKIRTLNNLTYKNTSFYYTFCYDQLEEVYQEMCKNNIEDLYTYELLFKRMVKVKKYISCKDFKTKGDAQEFFDSISGERSKAYRLTKKEPITCKVDPYNLDADEDCNVCESYKTEYDDYVEKLNEYRLIYSCFSKEKDVAKCEEINSAGDQIKKDYNNKYYSKYSE